MKVPAVVNVLSYKRGAALYGGQPGSPLAPASSKKIVPLEKLNPHTAVDVVEFVSIVNPETVMLQAGDGQASVNPFVPGIVTLDHVALPEETLMVSPFDAPVMQVETLV